MKALRIVCFVVSLASLATGLGSAISVFSNGIVGGDAFAQYKTTLLISTIVWFLTAPFWMVPELFRRKKG